MSSPTSRLAFLPRDILNHISTFIPVLSSERYDRAFVLPRVCKTWRNECVALQTKWQTELLKEVCLYRTAETIPPVYELAQTCLDQGLSLRKTLKCLCQVPRDVKVCTYMTPLQWEISNAIRLYGGRELGETGIHINTLKSKLTHIDGELLYHELDYMRKCGYVTTPDFMSWHCGLWPLYPYRRIQIPRGFGKTF